MGGIFLPDHPFMSDDDYKRVGPIVAERDDDDGLAAAVVPGGRKSGSRPQADAEPRRAVQHEPRTARNGGRVFTVMLLIVVIALGAYSAHLRQQQVETHTALENLQARFDHLEEQILTTDESLSESGAAIQAKLREVDSEIRKLWGVSNDRNRKAIAAHDEAIQALQGSLAKLEQTQNNQVTTLSSLRSRVEAFDRKIGVANAEVLAAMAEIEQIRGSLATIRAAADRVEATANRVNTLENRVRTHEEAIQSIDAFRRQTNQSLLQLRQQTGAQ